MSSKRRKKQKKNSGKESRKPQLGPTTDYMPVQFPADSEDKRDSESSNDKQKKDSPEPEKSPEKTEVSEESLKDSQDADTDKNSDSADYKRKGVMETITAQATDREAEGKRRKLLAEAWKARDNLYQKLFGEPSYVTPADYGPPSEEVPDDFEEKVQFSSDTGDPGDPTLEEQHLAVLAYGPDPLRPYWTYVTAGLASPWLQYEPQEASGFGCELLVKSPDDSPWAAQFLRSLAFYVFNHAGVLSPGVRIGLNNPIDPSGDSAIKNAFIWYADEAPDGMYELPSGYFAMLAAIGMTDGERAYADVIEEYGTWCLNALLKKTGYGQVTDPSRGCLTERDDIDDIVASVTNFANAFRNNEANQMESP